MFGKKLFGKSKWKFFYKDYVESAIYSDNTIDIAQLEDLTWQECIEVLAQAHNRAIAAQKE